MAARGARGASVCVSLRCGGCTRHAPAALVVLQQRREQLEGDHGAQHAVVLLLRRFAARRSVRHAAMGGMQSSVAQPFVACTAGQACAKQGRQTHHRARTSPLPNASLPSSPVSACSAPAANALGSWSAAAAACSLRLAANTAQDRDATAVMGLSKPRTAACPRKGGILLRNGGMRVQ